MKKTFANFLILTLGVSIGATVLIALLFEFIGNYTYFILVGIGFISMMSIFLTKTIR